MPNASFAQYDFRGGEWSPFAQGRMDDPRYKTGMSVCLNSYPLEEGAWTRRSGTRTIATTRGGAAAKLLPFNFSQRAPYNLEISAGHLRAFAAGEIVTDNINVAVSSISSATPAVLETAAATAWATDDHIIFKFNGVAATIYCPLLANRQFRVVKSTTTQFRLYDAVTGAAIDGAAVAWSASANLLAVKVMDLATVYTEDQRDDVRIVQSERSALLLHAAVPPQVLTLTDDPTDTAFGQFSIEEANFLDGPYLDPIPGTLVTPSATTGVISLTLSLQDYVAATAYAKGDYVSSGGIGYRSLVGANVGNTPASSPTYWEVVVPGEAIGPNGFAPTDVGRLVRLFNPTPPAAWSSGTTYAKGDFATSSSISYRSRVSGNLNQTPATSPQYWEVLSPGWTWGKITAVANTGVFNTSTATFFGNLSQNGGLASAFDGSTSKAATASATLSHADTAGTVRDYVGAHVGTPAAVFSVVVSPPADLGFAKVPYSSGNAFLNGPVTINVYGKTSAPASSSDGTLLATAQTTDMFAPVTLVSTNRSTPYGYVWVELVVPTARPSGSGVLGNFIVGVAQAQFYGSGGSAGGGAFVQILGPKLPNTTIISVWQLGAYSDTTGWPTNGCYHEGRFWLAGAIPNRFDSTISNDNGAFDFSPTNAAGTVGDANAISGTFNSSDINTIFWMQPDLQGIVCGTQGGEWLLQASAANNPLTPAGIQAHRVTKYGCANVEPKRVGVTTMFVQRFGRRLHEYLSDIFSGRFFAPNATERAKHITKPGIAELAYQEELTPILWARLKDGTFAGSSFRRVALSSSSEPVFNGWHRHELGSGRVIESLVVGPTADGNLDALTMVTNDPETGVRQIEVMEPLFDEENEITDAWFLDSAVAPLSAETVEVSGAPHLRLHGLWSMNGKTVAAWVGGLDCGDYVVDNGRIDVPFNTANALLTVNYLTDLSTSGKDFGTLAVPVDGGMLTIPAVVGASFVSRGQLLRPNTPIDTGSRQGPAFGKSRRAHQYAMLAHNAQGMSVGTDFNFLMPVIFRDDAGDPLPPDELFSGMVQDTLGDDSSLDGRLAWEISRPYPATVVSAGMMLSTQDR